MTQWEYKVIFQHTVSPHGSTAHDELNQYGLDGWELVTSMDRYLYMKRPLPPTQRDVSTERVPIHEEV